MASPFLDDKIEASLVFESERLKTFFEARADGTCGTARLWSSAADITPKQLAKDGFYFLKKDDHCACVFCRGVIGMWEKGDRVRSEHQKHFPRCPFVRGEPIGNIPIILCEHLEPMWRETLMEKLEERNKIPSRIMYSEFSPPGKREASFDSMPFSVEMKKKLSAAGFYNFTNISDHVRCFRCGLGLRDWSESMDPLEMHAKFSPNCMVVKLHSSVVKTNSRRRKRLNDSLVDLVVQHGDIERHVTDLGFPLHAIKAAVKKRLKQGIKFYRVQECTEAVLVAMEDKMRAEMAVARMLADVAKRHEDTRMGVHDWTTNLTTPEHLEILSDEERHEALAVFLQPPQQPPEEAFDENETPTAEEEEEEVPPLEIKADENPGVVKCDMIPEMCCKVCLDEEAVVVLLPCRHLCMCPRCAISFGECPICRKPIEDFLKIIRC